MGWGGGGGGWDRARPGSVVGGSKSDPLIWEMYTYHTKVGSSAPNKDSNDGRALVHRGQHSFVFSMHI